MCCGFNAYEHYRRLAAILSAALPVLLFFSVAPSAQQPSVWTTPQSTPVISPVVTSQSCRFIGRTVANGQSVTAYQSSSVSAGAACIAQTRSCTNGTLSGSFSGASCTVQPPPPPVTESIAASDPITVVQTDQVNYVPVPWIAAGKARLIDAPLTTVTDGSTRYWFNVGLAKFIGTLDRPFASLQWVRPQEQAFSDPNNAGLGGPWKQQGSDWVYGGEALWITNIYQIPDGILTFMHVETPRVVSGAYYTGHGRVGLAWSYDFGEHFAYLGDIIVPFGDPDNFNVQGVPYIIKNGYFYIYYDDNCSDGNKGVARAPVADVVMAAKNATTTQWKKYQNGSWDSPGLGGACNAISIEDGITHTDGAYSTYTGKYYLLLTSQDWGGNDTWIKLYESGDGINWSFARTIAEEPASALSSGQAGYQYATIVDQSGSDNAVVGERFYVYSGFFQAGETSDTVLRWLVNLNGLPVSLSSYNAASGYASTMAAASPWSYYYKAASIYIPMTWSPTPWDPTIKIWTGNEMYALIGQGWMTPGMKGDVVLAWTAPQSGTVHITGTVSKRDITCGDGVVAFVSHNATQLWEQTIAYNDDTGKAYNLTLSITAGDRVYFELNNNGNNYCDSTSWNPTITYGQ